MRLLQASDASALRSAGWRVVRLWRPMALWTLLVWVLVGALLGPLSSALLGWHAVRGPAPVMGNEALLAWLMTPRGAVWALLAGGLALMGGLLRYAGLYHIVTDDLAGRRATVRRTGLHLAPDLPPLFRLALVAAAAGVLLAALLVAGIAAVRLLLIDAYDINYYLSERPSEWRYAVVTAGAWVAVWSILAAFVVGRVILAIPAYLDGHRPLRVAFRRARARGQGQKPRLFRLLTLSVGLWLGSRLAAHGVYYATGSAVVEWVAAAAPSLRPVVLVTALYAAGLFALDAIVGFIGFSFVATVVTKFYHEDTVLHSRVDTTGELRELPWAVMMRARPWLRPRRMLPAVAAIVVVGLGASGLLLERIPELRPVVVIAHRGGPPPAPENTLASMERAIAAGADESEIDVQRTADGVVVVIHDADLMRVAGSPHRVAAVPYGEIAGLVQTPDDGSPRAERRVATLDDFLERARGRIRLAIELKYYGPDPELAPAVVERVRARGMEAEVSLMSLNLDAVEQLVHIAPEFRIGYVAAATIGDVARLPVAFLAMSRQRTTPRLVRSARDRGIAVQVWTVNQATAMAEFMERGVDGLITDDPALAVQVRDEMLDMSPVARLLLRFRPALRVGTGADADA